MLKNRLLYTSLALAMLSSGHASWAAGESFVASEPVKPNWTCNMNLTGAFLQDADPNHQYWLSGQCVASVQQSPQVPAVPLPVTVKEVAATYNTSTKKNYEIVTVTFGGKDYVLISNSNCATDPYINKGVSCTTTSKVNPFPMLNVTDADFPLARGMVSYSAAKAKSPQPKPLAIQILTPNQNDRFVKNQNINISAKAGDGYAADGLKCCEVEIQQQSGGNWITYKSVKEPLVGKPGGHNFSYEWFKQAADINSTTKFRLRMRIIKNADYDTAPWTDYVDFRIENPIDGPVGDTKIGGFKSADGRGNLNPATAAPNPGVGANPGAGVAANTGGVKPAQNPGLAANPEGGVAANTGGLAPGQPAASGGIVIVPGGVKPAPKIDVTCPAGWTKQADGSSCKAANAFMQCPNGSQYFIQSGPTMGCK